MVSASDEHDGGKLGINTSYGLRGAAALGLKALASVENISGSRGIGWR